MSDVNMTWEEFKAFIKEVDFNIFGIRAKHFGKSMIHLEMNYQPYKGIRFFDNGYIELRFDMPYMTPLTHDRTPYQMYQIIKALTEKEVK